MAGMGIGASVGRKEDERFLRGRGQYVGDFRIPGAREVAFVRSSVAHAYLRSITIPDKHKGMVVTADDLTNVKPIRTTPSVSGLKHSREPILAAGKVRFVGEIIAACVGRSRAEQAFRQRRLSAMHAPRHRPSMSKVCAGVRSAASRTGASSGSGSRSSASKAPMGPACWQAGDGRSSPATNLPSQG